MKLLSVTSFFFFIVFCVILYSCTQDKDLMEQQVSEVSILEENTLTCSKEGKYEIAIYYANELLELAKRKNDTSIYKIAYDKLSRYYFVIKRKDLAIYYADKLQKVAEKTNDTLKLAKAKWKKGYYYKKMDSLKLSYLNYAASKDFYLKINDNINVGRVLLEIANIQKTEGNFGASELSAQEALEYIEGTDDLKTIGGLYYILSLVSKETGKLKAAEERVDKALNLAKEITSKKKISAKTIAKFKNTKANILMESGQYDKAILAYEEVLNENKNDTLEFKRVNTNLAYVLFLKNGFNKKSDSLLKNALSYYYTRKNISGIYNTQLKLAKLYNKKDVEESLKYSELALESAEELANPTSIYEALGIKIKNNYTTEDFDRFIKLGEELERREEDLNYFYIHERFNYNKIENKAIKAENKAIVLDNKASRRSNFILFLLLVLVIILVAIYFIYQKIKRRHKIEKVKTVHNTEVRISTKVHDELANDIHYLLAQLETSNPDKEAVLDKLDVIYNNARDISKQNRSVETGDGFPDELTNLFRSYQSDEVNVILKRYDIDIWNGISEHIKVTLYRVLQELLTNMKKHSNATLVAVSIEKYKKELFVQFKDNGKGFSEGISKNGLLNAENRIHAIKGKLTFDTELHQGCKFSINVPL